MSHNHTKSDDEQLFAAIQGGADEQNTDGADKNQQLDAAAATNQEYDGPTAPVTAKTLADVGMSNQSKPDSKTTEINPRHTLAAETEEATGLDYINNPDFVTSSGETIAQKKQWKEEILSRGNETSEEEDNLAAQEDSVGDPRSETRATRPGVMFVADRNKVVRRQKQKILSRESEALEEGDNLASQIDCDGSPSAQSRAGVVAVQHGHDHRPGKRPEPNLNLPPSTYTAIIDNRKAKPGSNMRSLRRTDLLNFWAGRKVRRYNRQHTASKGSRAQATLAQNDALMSSGEQFGTVPASILNANDNGRAVNSEAVAGPEVALFVANNNNEVESSVGAHGGANESQVDLVHAVMVVNPSDDERSREELPLASAEAMVPLHKQICVWIGCAAFLSTIIVALIVMLLIVINQPPMPPAPMSAMPSLSHEPSLSPSSIKDWQLNVLVQISEVLTSENWVNKNGWGSTSSNICNWYGVVCRTDLVNDFVAELNLAANNLTGEIDDITMLGNLQYLRKLDLDSNSIVGNLTVFSLNLIQFSHLTYVDLRLNKLSGSIPSEVCDSIGDMDLRVDCSIECDCCNHDVLCEECTDVPGWHNSDGEANDCAWYAKSIDQCEENGSCCKNDGHTANTACCVCGGGIIGLVNPSPSSAPSSIPTQLPTTLYQTQGGSALVALYDAMNGDDWGESTNWLSDAPICYWYGISCTYDNDVIEIILSSNNLQGSLPSELGMLTNLEHLDLFNNLLTGSIPSELGMLTNLERLDLNHGNLLTGSLPSELGMLTNLEYLDLDGNLLTGSLPSELGMLTNLEHLELYKNSLTGSIPSELGMLTNLEYLDLYGISLTGIIPSELGMQKNLRYLYLYGNSLTGTIPSELGMLINLWRLYLNKTSLTGTIPSELGMLTNLRYLDLDQNLLAGAIPSELGMLTNLTRLLLYINSLTGSIPSELGMLKNLWDLSLYNNLLTGTLPNEICDLRHYELGGSMSFLSADCGEVTCPCCTRCY